MLHSRRPLPTEPPPLRHQPRAARQEPKREDDAERLHRQRQEHHEIPPRLPESFAD